MTDISFIIPAYNASGTIVRTLESIVTQSWGDISYEIIVVDDCSTDDTCEVIERYRRDVLCMMYDVSQSNLTLLRQPENHRQGAARNRGLKVAKGEYVMFVDSDDAIAKGALDALRFAKENKLDAAVGVLAQVEGGKIIHVFESPIPDGAIMSGHDFAEKYFSTSINNYPVIYVLRREYLIDANIPFEEDRRYEDGDWCNKAVYYCKTIGFVNQIMYHYYLAENVNSTNHELSPQTLGDWVNMAYRQWVFAEQIREDAPLFYDKLIYSCRHIVNGHFSFRRLTRFTPKQVGAIFERVGDEAMRYLADRGGWARFPLLCFRSRGLVVGIIAIVHPLAAMGRWITKLIRKIR